MAKKFFSVEIYSSMNGEIVNITTSLQLGSKVETFDQIQDYCIEVANLHQCKGAVRNEYGIKVLDFNYSEYCENNICFSWQNDKMLQDFIDAHAEEKEDAENTQYQELKRKYPDVLLLFLRGDFYETYKEDAITAAKVLGITLTYRNNKGASKGNEMAGFPRHALDTYLPKLVRAGIRIAICDQLDPRKAKKGITELVTPNKVAV